MNDSLSHERRWLRRTASWLTIVAGVWLFALPPDAATVRGAFACTSSQAEAPVHDARPSILVYHRFASVVADSMTVRTATLRWQLQYLKQHGYRTIPLRALVAWRLHQGPPPPPRAVVVTADDGHRSVFTDMLPLVREFSVPVTLFIYPSAISNASYAMTWEQLGALNATGLFDIQSHTYWHPNFATEKRRLAPTEYRALALMQLTRPKTLIRQRLGLDVTLIAWPFGIYDEGLIRMAGELGYLAGVTLDRRLVTPDDPIMALPRFLVTDGASGKSFAAMLPSELP